MSLALFSRYKIKDLEDPDTFYVKLEEGENTPTPRKKLPKFVIIGSVCLLLAVMHIAFFILRYNM